MRIMSLLEVSANLTFERRWLTPVKWRDLLPPLQGIRCLCGTFSWTLLGLTVPLGEMPVEIGPWQFTSVDHIEDDEGSPLLLVLESNVSHLLIMLLTWGTQNSAEHKVWFPVPGRAPTPWQRAKTTPCPPPVPAPRNRGPNTSAQGTLSCWGQHMQCRAGRNNALTQRRDRAKSAAGVCLSPHGLQLPWPPIGLHTPFSCCSGGTLTPFLWTGNTYTSGPLMYMLNQNKETLTEPATGKGIHSHTSWKGRLCGLLIHQWEGVPGPRPRLQWLSRGWRTAGMRSPFLVQSDGGRPPSRPGLTRLRRRFGRRNAPGCALFPEKNKVNEDKVISCDLRHHHSPAGLPFGRRKCPRRKSMVWASPLLRLFIRLGTRSSSST